MIAERKGDPAVMVDIPQTPQAEELAKADENKNGGEQSVFERA